MKALVFGRTGQVATELLRRGPAHGIAIEALGRDAADLSDPAACAAAIAGTEADVVINAAAYTAVDKAEEDRATAHVVNAEAPGAMARACAARGLPFLHVSTDYVFDGSGETPFQPDAPTGPLGAYGQTKRDGERAVQEAGGQSLILRTSWVFSAHGNNFLKTMLRLSESRDALSIVGDQIGGPTPAADIAEALLVLAQAAQAPSFTGGVHHFSGAPDTSWAGFAREIFAQAGRAVTVSDIPTEAYPTPAARPRNSRLDGSALEAAFGIPRPDWKAGVATILAEVLPAAE